MHSSNKNVYEFLLSRRPALQLNCGLGLYFEYNGELYTWVNCIFLRQSI